MNFSSLFAKLMNKGAGIKSVPNTTHSAFKNLNTRNRTTLAFAWILLATLTMAFALRSRIDENWQDFFSKRNDLKALSYNDFTIQGTQPAAVSCDQSCQTRGEPFLTWLPDKWTDFKPLNNGSDQATTLSDGSPVRRWSRVRLTLPTSTVLEKIAVQDAFVVALPMITYKSATLRLDGEVYAKLYDSQRIVVRVSKLAVAKPNLTLELVIELYDHSIAYRNEATTVPPYIATTSASKDFEKFLANQRDSRGAVLGTMSRILIAFFALFLFVVIDSTPESFGLAVFLGFEAAAIVLGEGWLKLPASKLLANFCYQMGDIFRLFFFIQISRVFRPNAKHWLVAGTMLSIPYGISRYMETTWGLHGLDVIPRFRDLIAGTVGTAFCLYALLGIANKPLPWRKAALLFAAACSFQQVLDPLTHYFPLWNGSGDFRGFMNSYQTFSVYFGALSALTNISTLENRVERLSMAKVRSDMIEQEMSLGQSVQRAFLSVGNLPTDFEMAQVHEAAVYVSGDIYFVHWDEDQQRLVVVMCDLTGHGVQAALKATATYMLARNIWMTGSSAKSGRLPEFRRQLASLMELFSETPDLPTFAGIEFYPNTRQLCSYRTNFNAPIVIEPHPEQKWLLRLDTSFDGQPSISSLKPGSLLVLLSDGYIMSSRHLLHLTKYLTSHLETFDGSAEGLKELICQFDKRNPSRPVDDRTMLVLCWQRHGATDSTSDSTEVDEPLKKFA